MKKLSVIIVNYNVQYFLELCLHSVLRASEGIDAEVIVVDNNSADGSCAFVRAHFAQVRLIENTDNKGFSKANNQAVALAQGEFLLFLNPDTVVPEDFFHKTLAYMDAHPKVGALGPRLIDGKGSFAPDAKKSFPTLSVALFKTTGLNKIFSRSAYINKYYAVHIGEHQVAPVEVLSGCCMMLRSALLPTIGPAFDEDYFMYCEDVDLSYRVEQAGYQNIYFPEATIVHYKGESTRKASLKYIRIFNEALSTFVRKHYTKANATLFILLINIGIALRAVWAFVKMFFKLLKTPIFDAILLLGVLVMMNQLWVEGVKHLKPVASLTLYATFPVYILLWTLSIYLNGGYDQPYRGLRVLRGMVIGTIIILAYFGILSAEYRYSRAVILFSGALGAIGILGMRELLNWMGIAKVVRYNQVPKRAVIVATEAHYVQTSDMLEQVHYAPDIIGRISVQPNESNALADVANMHQVIRALNIDEVVFCVNGLRYETILAQMQKCGNKYDYKIHIPGSRSFVGSNSSASSGDLYTADTRYNIATFISLRNKRVFDFVAALVLLLLSPFLMFWVHSPVGLWGNIFNVLIGNKTWVGYDSSFDALPKIKKNILPTYNLQKGYEPTEKVRFLAASEYARHYVVGLDFSLLLRNLKFV
ncbi:MAG: glycosyltransferase [Chitinophagaceae bacterium]|nr:glycosyltransferase [Chitinophagaceae bacterium]